MFEAHTLIETSALTDDGEDTEHPKTLNHPGALHHAPH